MHQRVKFEGKEMWRHNDILAPLDHYDEKGRLQVSPYTTYGLAAIGNDGNIYRYGAVIGNVKQLEVIE